MSQSTPIYLPKNLENVPAQVLAQLRHRVVKNYGKPLWIIVIFLKCLETFE